ncbi:MAG: hypothetical protein HOE19_03495 [Candidatus Komeilibacteria bacterium]|nr:hypothetical protein [Candidatus Komeilibacteria bacterium]
MKKYAFLTLSILALLALGACSDTDKITDVQSDNNNQPTITAGEIHTEFLELLYAENDFAKREKSSQVSSATTTANEILIRHGLKPMAEADVETELQRGREMAQMDPVQLIESILTPEELIWWDRFSWEAKVFDAKKVYRQHCNLYGAPTEGSMLSNLLDMSLSSAEFWDVYREKDIPTYQNPYIPMTKSWRGVLRFVVAVVVDGGAGAACAAGGPIVSGVVGGLASAGADGMIFD